MSETSETLVKLSAVVAKFKGMAGAASQAKGSISKLGQTVELAGGGWITTKEGEVWKPDEHPRNAKGHFVKKTAASFLFGQTKKAVFNKQVAKTVAAPSEAPKVEKNISADTQVKYDLGPGDKAYHSTMGNVAVLHPDKSVTLYTTAGSVKEYAADDPFVQKKVLPNIANGVSKLFDEDKTAFEVPANDASEAESALHSAVKVGDQPTKAQMALLPRGTSILTDSGLHLKKGDDHGWIVDGEKNVGTWTQDTEGFEVAKIGDGEAWEGKDQKEAPKAPEAPTEAPEATTATPEAVKPPEVPKAKVTTHLQGIGQHEAKAVSDLKPGDTLVYNYGSTAKVKSVTKKTPNTYTLVTETPDGKEYTSTKVGSTLLGYQSPEVQAKAKAIADKINAKINEKKAQAPAPEAPQAQAPAAGPLPTKAGSILTPAQLVALPTGTKVKINSLGFIKQDDGTWKAEGHTLGINAKGQVTASSGTVITQTAPPKLDSLPEASKAEETSETSAPEDKTPDLTSGPFPKPIKVGDLADLPAGAKIGFGGKAVFEKQPDGSWNSTLGHIKPGASEIDLVPSGTMDLADLKPNLLSSPPAQKSFQPAAAPSKPAPVAVEGKKNKLTSYNPEDTPEGGGSYTPVEGTKSLDDILSEKGFKHPVSGATFHLDAGDSLLQHKLTPTSFAVIGADGTKKFQVNSKGKQYKWSPHVPKSNFKIIATPTQELGEKPKEPETPHAVTNMKGNTFTHPVSGLKVDIKPGEKLMQHNFTPNSFVVMDDQGNMLYKIDVKGKQQKAGTNLKASNYFEAYNGTTGKAVNTPNKPVEFEKGKFQAVSSVLMKLYEANDGDTVTVGGDTYTKDGDNWSLTIGGGGASGSFTAAQAASAITIDLNSSLPEGTKSSGGVPLQPTKMKSWLESQSKGTKIKTSVPNPSGESYTVEFTKNDDGTTFSGHSGTGKYSQVGPAFVASIMQAWPEGAAEGLTFEEPPKKVTNDHGVPVHDTDQMTEALINQPVGASLSTSFVVITKGEDGKWSTGGGYPWQAEDLAKLVVDYQPSHKAEVKFTAPVTSDQLSAHGTPIGTVQALQTHLTAAPVGTIVGINATRLKKINSKEWRSIDADGKFVTNSKLWSNDDLGSVLFKKVMKTELKTEYPATPVGKVASKVSAAKAKKAAASKVQPTKTFESVSDVKEYHTTLGDGSAAKEMAAAIGDHVSLYSWSPVNPFNSYDEAVTQAAQPGLISKLDEVDANLTAAKAVEGLTAAEKSAITKYQKKVVRFKQLALAAQQMSVGNLPDPPLPDDIYNFNWGNSVSVFPFNMASLEHGLKLKQNQLQFKASLTNLSFDPFDGTVEEYGSYLENTPHKDLVPYLEQSDLKALTLFHLQAPGHTSLNVSSLQKKAANTQYQKGVSSWLASQKAGEPLPLKLVENPSKFPEKPDFIEDDLWDNIKFALSGEFVPPAGMSKAQNLSFVKVPEQAQVAIEQAINNSGTYVNTGTRQKLFNHLALSGIWYKDDLTYESPAGNFPLSPGMAVYETDTGALYFLDKEKKEQFENGTGEVYTTYYNPNTSTFGNSWFYSSAGPKLAYTAPYKVTFSDSVQDGHSFDSQAWQSLESFEDQTAPRKLTGVEIVALKKTLVDKDLGLPTNFSMKAQTIMVDRPDLAEMVAYKDVKGHYRVIDTSPPVKWADLVKDTPLANVPDVTTQHVFMDAIAALKAIPDADLPSAFKVIGATYDPTATPSDLRSSLYTALMDWTPPSPEPEMPIPKTGISGDLFKVPASALKLPGSGGQTKTFFVDADGTGYLGKPNTAKKFRADSEQAAGDIGRLFGFNVPPSTVRTIDGEYTHLQRITNASGDLTGVHPDDLDDVSLISVMQGHVLDWTVSNHDSHGGNYLRSADDGTLVKIDLGQAWKALGQDKLEVGWELPGNFGEVWYNSFYKGVQSKKISKERLDLVAKAALTKARRISFTNDDPFREHLEQAFANRTSFPQGMTKAQFIDLAMKRKQDTFGDFFDFYKKLYSKAGYDFPFTEDSFTSTKLEGTEAHLSVSQELVDEATASGSYGKSLFFSGPDVEDAHVLLFSTKNKKGGKTFRGDMKIRPQGDSKIMQWLSEQGVATATGSAQVNPKVASKTLPMASDAFSSLVNLAKTVSSHAGDGGYNQTTVSQAQSTHANLKIDLQKLKDGLAKNPLFVNNFHPLTFQSGHQQQAWMAWAEDMIGRFDATFEAMGKGEKSPKWAQEEPVYDPPKGIDISGSPKPVETVEVGGKKYTKYSDWNFIGPDGVLTEHEYANLKTSPGATTKPLGEDSQAPESTVEVKVNPFKVKKVNFSTFSVTEKVDENGFVTEGPDQTFNSDAYEVTSTDHPGITIQYAAHNGMKGDKTNIGRLQFKIEDFDGSQSKVEAALNMIRQMGVSMDEADETSMEVFFWKHMYGILKDRSAGHQGKDLQVLNTIDAAYKANPNMSPDQELLMLKDAWKISMGAEVVDKADWRPKFENGRQGLKSYGGEQTGRPYWMRPDFRIKDYKDWTKGLPPSRVFWNASGGDSSTSAIRPYKSGMFLSGEERTKFTGSFAVGEGSSGGSTSSADRQAGGSNVIFTRQGQKPKMDAQYFEPWVAGRTHTWAYQGDAFGGTEYKNNYSPFDLKDAAFKGTNRNGASNNEMDIKYGASAWDSVAVTVVSTADRKKVLDYFKSLGVTHIRGLPVEERVVDNVTDLDKTLKKVWDMAIKAQESGQGPGVPAGGVA